MKNSWQTPLNKREGEGEERTRVHGNQKHVQNCNIIIMGEEGL
jgi:hypothetical protein